MNSVQHCCQYMKEYIGNEDDIIHYSLKYDEYGISIHDGENGSVNSYIQIQYCPWCGKKLPESKREEWFEKLITLGYENPFSDAIPKCFLSDEWYKQS